MIIRPGIVIGFSPKVKKEDGFFSSLIEVLDEKRPAEYDAARQYQPTYLGHVSEVIKRTLESNLWGKTFPVAAPDLKTKYELAKDILSPFGVPVKGVGEDQPISTKKKEDLAELGESGLPIYSYEDVIQRTVEEIKHREQFTIG